MKTKKYFEYRYRGIGIKDPIGLFRQSYCRDCENKNQKDQRKKTLFIDCSYYQREEHKKII